MFDLNISEYSISHGLCWFATTQIALKSNDSLFWPRYLPKTVRSARADFQEFVQDFRLINHFAAELLVMRAIFFDLCRKRKKHFGPPKLFDYLLVRKEEPINFVIY